MGLQFDATITAGNVIEACILIGGWIIAIVRLGDRLKTVETNQDKHDVKLENLSKISNLQARFDERMSSLRRDIDELRRGKGFIQRELDGEYIMHGKVKAGED